MAVPGQNQKLSEDITNTISVKIEDHVHFKPNIQLLSSKNQNEGTGVYSILANQAHPQSQSAQTTYNSSSIFANLSQNDNISGALKVTDNSSALTFNSLPGTSQENSSVTNDITVSYNSSEQHVQPPQIFSASLNGANLLSSSAGVDSQLVDTNHQEKNVESNVSISQESFTHGISLTNNLHIGLPTMAGSSNTANVQQQSSLHIGLPTMTGPSTDTSNTQQQNNLHIGLPTMACPSSDSADIPQQSESGSVSESQNEVSSSIQFMQSSTGVQYSQGSSGIHYVQSATCYQVSANNMVNIDGNQSSPNQQSTYVLLQAAGDSESGTPPQMFLAMQTTTLSGQDSSPHQYITLQPVSVDGTDLTTNNMVQEGVGIQQTVMTGNELNSDGKSLVSEGGQQVVLSIPGQQTLIPSSTNNGQPSLVTYLQPLGNIGSNMEQGQVIMAASDLQGNLTLHNVTGINTNNKRSVLSSSRQSSQVGLTTPRRRLSQDPRSCIQCGRCFKYPSDLKKHLQIHTDIKKFACEDCNRTFRRLHQLNVHRRIHTGEKPYVCNRCGAQFRHDSTLTMHIRTRHDHLKPFTCEGCSKKFGRMSHLRKHQRNVCGRSGLRGTLAQCKYCDASFNKKSDLKAHFNLCEKKPDRVDKDAINPTPYPCETCGKEFSRVYDFKRHQLSHSDEKPYHCPQCGKMFKERSSLNKHVKRMHCSDGDGTIPIDDDGIIAGDDDEEDELSGDEQEHQGTLSCLPDSDHPVSQISTANVSAEALAQAGIITSRHEVMTAHGQTISATEILNFPEVAQALGINSGAHATVLDSDGHSTMIAITQPGNLETTEVSMDMEQNIIQDGSIIVSENHDGNTEQYISSTDGLQMNPVVTDSIDPSDHIHVVYNDGNSDGVIYNSASTSFNPDSLDSSMVFKQEDDDDHYMKQEEELADHVKAEQAAAHDLQPEDEQTSDIIPDHMLQEE